jgi:hypothetical protein
LYGRKEKGCRERTENEREKREGCRERRRDELGNYRELGHVLGRIEGKNNGLE